MATIANNTLIINTDYLASKIIGGSITDLVIPSNATNIRANAFYQNTNITSVKISSNVKKINSNAFYSCSGLTNIAFENGSITSIGSTAFNACSQLQEVILPEGLMTIGMQAFQSCYSLEKVIFPKTLATFDTHSNFGGCSRLKYVFFNGNSPVTSNLGRGVFSTCNNMRLFDMRNMLSAKDTGSGNFAFTSNTVYLYINVPDSLYTKFTALSNWSALKLKHFVHSCDVATFEDIESPIEGDYYSLKGDMNYLNPLGEKQIDIRQYANGQWVEVDIDE